ncbi:MAG: hypothetical protein Kapaf2KO_18960 [Candidatus Kapaibacteriales bacterium]
MPLFAGIVPIGFIINAEDETVLYEDSHFRVQESIISLNEPLSLPNLYEKGIIFEQYSKLDYPDHLQTFFDTKKSDIKEIKIRKSKDSITVIFEFTNGFSRYLVKK